MLFQTLRSADPRARRNAEGAAPRHPRPEGPALPRRTRVPPGGRGRPSQVQCATYIRRSLQFTDRRSFSALSIHNKNISTYFTIGNPFKSERLEMGIGGVIPSQ